MLYPIELLRHWAGDGRRAAEGVHVNQRSAICHSMGRAFCLPAARLFPDASCILQSSRRPSLQNARNMPHKQI